MTCAVAGFSIVQRVKKVPIKIKYQPLAKTKLSPSPFPRRPFSADQAQCIGRARLHKQPFPLPSFSSTFARISYPRQLPLATNLSSAFSASSKVGPSPTHPDTDLQAKGRSTAKINMDDFTLQPFDFDAVINWPNDPSRAHDATGGEEG